MSVITKTTHDAVKRTWARAGLEGWWWRQGEREGAFHAGSLERNTHADIILGQFSVSVHTSADVEIKRLVHNLEAV